jgi:hypothetical protein
MSSPPPVIRVVRALPPEEQAAMVEAFKHMLAEGLAAGLAELRLELRSSLAAIAPPTVTFAPGSIVVNVQPAQVNVPMTVDANFAAPPATVVNIEPGAVQVTNQIPDGTPTGDIEIIYDANGRVTGTRRV